MSSSVRITELWKDAFLTIGIAYSTFGPELRKQSAERRGESLDQYGIANDNAVSQAIISDFKEAGQQLKPAPTKGFAWGIREAIFGAPEGRQAAGIVQVPTRSDNEMKESPRELVEKAQSADREGR